MADSDWLAGALAQIDACPVSNKRKKGLEWMAICCVAGNRDEVRGVHDKQSEVLARAELDVVLVLLSIR